MDILKQAKEELADGSSEFSYETAAELIAMVERLRDLMRRVVEAYEDSGGEYIPNDLVQEMKSVNA